MKILVTGGAGYIGSHFVKKIISSGHTPVVLDNLSRGFLNAVPGNVEFHNDDLRNDHVRENLREILKDVEAVVHFAAFAYVGESVENPGLYYHNNVAGSLNLIMAAAEAGIKKIVFSSTCSVYGNPANIPISEDEKPGPINPYARTKLMIENILSDYHTSHGLNYVALRYFNAAGADPEGEIGESHNPETHLIPIVLQTALGKRDKINIFGDDYNTPDGTNIRDYIHVDDLAEAHLKALNFLEREKRPDVFNLGTGHGASVKEIIEAAEKITGRKINQETGPRRPGDPDILVADNKKAKEILGWVPRYNLNDIIQTAWNWQKNPKY